MDRDTLIALAARVEAAGAHEQHAVLQTVATRLGLYSSLFRLIDGHAFLDAAAALVSAGCDWAAGRDLRGFHGAAAWARVFPAGVQKDGTGNILAATPALALTAAALRARAEEARDE